MENRSQFVAHLLPSDLELNDRFPPPMSPSSFHRQGSFNSVCTSPTASRSMTSLPQTCADSESNISLPPLVGTPSNKNMNKAAQINKLKEQN